MEPADGGTVPPDTGMTGLPWVYFDWWTHQ